MHLVHKHCTAAAGCSTELRKEKGGRHNSMIANSDRARGGPGRNGSAVFMQPATLQQRRQAP